MSADKSRMKMVAYLLLLNMSNKHVSIYPNDHTDPGTL